MKKLLSSMFIVMLMLTLLVSGTKMAKEEDGDNKGFIPCNIEYSVEKI